MYVRMNVCKYKYNKHTHTRTHTHARTRARTHTHGTTYEHSSHLVRESCERTGLVSLLLPLLLSVRPPPDTPPLPLPLLSVRLPPPMRARAHTHRRSETFPTSGCCLRD